jgi:hypothetical protein
MRQAICIALILNLGCATTLPRSNKAVALFLANVTNPDDSRLSPVLDRVLTDIEQGAYRYDDQVRKYVFDAIRLRPHDVRLRERVRLIARRQIPVGSSWRAVLEFVSVLGALGVLTELNDKDAVTLNELRLTDPLLRHTAVDDLRSLKAWDATDQVARAFAGFQRLPKRDPAVLGSYLLFLSESPMTLPSVCTGVVHSLSEVESCCPSAHAAAVDLEVRLRCATSGQ